MTSIYYIARGNETERKQLQTLVKKYRKLQPKLKIRDIEILIKALKFYNEVSK